MLEKHRDLLKDHQQLNLHQVIHHQAFRITKLELLNIDTLVRDVVEDQVSDAVKRAMDAPLKARFRDLSTYDMKYLLHKRMFETDHHKGHEAHQQLYESLERSMKVDNADELEKDLAEERRRKKRKQNIPKPPSEAPTQPPPHPPPSGSAGKPGSSGGAGTLQSMQPPHAPQSSSQKNQPDSATESSHPKSSRHVTYKAWTTTETRHMPSVSVEHDLGYDTGSPNEDPSSAEEEDNDDDNMATHKPKRDQ